MFINYEKIGRTFKLFFPKYSKEIWGYCYEKKIEQNCTYIKKNEKKVLKKLRKKYGKEPLRVAFLCNESEKWKCQSLYDLLLKNKNFHPYILATKTNANEHTTYPMTSKHVIKTHDFFKKKNMETYFAYDIKKECFIPIEEFKPDIIFYQAPWYNETSQGPVIASKYALTYYVPYFIANVASDMEYNLRFHQYLHKHYILNDIIKDFYSPKMKNMGKNLHVVGHTQLDYFFLNNKQNTLKKYVIYAPHWSINYPRENYATFEWSGKYILEFAKSHPEINWIFKPHPALERRLETENILNKEEIKKYWQEWADIGIVCETGDYLDLFLQSYAMITDCGSFLTEYFLTENPVIHLVSKTSAGYNPSVDKITKSYYQAHNTEELKNYLEEVILKKSDKRKQERLNLLKELGLKNNYCAKNIIDDITRELND